MPVTVTMSRGNPLPWPVALLFTLVGAGLIIAGFTVVGKVDVPGGDTFGVSILNFIAFLLIVPPWIVFLVSLSRRRRRRRAAAVGLPRELPEPPGRDDPATVAAVVGAGKPSGRAIAATTLGLADRRVIDIQEHGDRCVIDVPADAVALTTTDQIVLDALRARANEQGHVVGPPIFPDKPSWWRTYARDARTQGVRAGYLENRIPFVGLMLVSILSATGLALIFFWYIASFVGFILFANGVPHLIAGASGYRLTESGVAYRARWVAFGRYIRAHESLREVGPAAVAVWGPNLVYGVLVGEGDRAAAALTPDVGRDDLAPDELVRQFEMEL